jgi:hypothetical protein
MFYDDAERNLVSIHAYNSSAKTYSPLRLDKMTSTLKMISNAHSKIHDGSSFTAYYTATTAATISHRNGVYIKTPATAGGNLVHLLASFAASSAARLDICEAPTIAANVGTHTSAIMNRYRDSATASGCFNNATTPAAGYITTLNETQLAADGTWATGTIIRTESLVAGAAAKIAGGAGRDAQEYILKANTAYVFLLTNLTADATVHYILLDWYEQVSVA